MTHDCLRYALRATSKTAARCSRGSLRSRSRVGLDTVNQTRTESGLGLRPEPFRLPPSGFPREYPLGTGYDFSRTGERLAISITTKIALVSKMCTLFRLHLPRSVVFITVV